MNILASWHRYRSRPPPWARARRRVRRPPSTRRGPSRSTASFCRSPLEACVFPPVGKTEVTHVISGCIKHLFILFIKNNLIAG